MRRDATSPTRRSAPRALRGVAAVLLAIGGSPAFAAGDFAGRADLTYADTENTGTSSEYFRQLYYVGYRRNISQPTSYRLSFQYQDDRGQIVLPEASNRLRSRILEPAGTIEHRLEGFGLGASYRRNDEDSLAPDGSSVSRNIARYGAKGYVRPFTDAEVTLGVDRLQYQGTDLDSKDDRIGLGFRYSGESLQITNENRLQFFDDARARVNRLSMGPRVATTYLRTAETYSLSATYTVDYFRTEQRAEGSFVLTEYTPAAGLFGNDNLPVDTDPLTTSPDLVDRVFDVSAGMSLGPTGASFQNIAVDMGPFVTVSELRIHVRAGDGSPVPSGGPITWTVYASGDGLRWALVEGAIAVFSPAMSAWVMTFTPTNARYFKAVNFGVNTIDTFVTEVQTFVQETIRPNQLRVSSAFRQGVSIIASGRPWSRLYLGYSVTGNADTFSAYGSRGSWSRDVSSNLEARLGAFRGVTFGGGHALMFAREELGVTQASNSVSGSIRYMPIEQFDTRLDLRRTDDRLQTRTVSVASSTNRISLGTRVEPYQTVRLNLAGGFSVQEVDGRGTSQYANANGDASIDVLRDLRLGLGATVQRLVSTSGDTSQQLPLPLVRLATHELYTADAEYRASAQLRLFARVGYAVAELEEGIIQMYRAAWSPFPGGAVQLSLDYVEEIDPLTGRALRRISATPYWAVNRHTALQLSYNMVRGRSNDPVRQENLYLTLSVRL